MRGKFLAPTLLAVTASVGGIFFVDTAISSRAVNGRLQAAETHNAVTRARLQVLEADILKLRARVEKTEADDMVAFRVLASHGRRLRRFERAIPIEVR